MSQETGQRVGIGLRNSQGSKTTSGLKLVNSSKKQYVSVWDALQLQDVDAFKEEQKRHQERTMKEKKKLKEMLDMQMKEH